MFNLYLLLLVSAALVPCLLPLFLQRGKRVRYSFSFYMIMGIGLQAILAIPAGFLQAYQFISQVQDKSVLSRMALLLLGAPFNMGGFVVARITEELAGPPTAARSGVASGAITHFHVFLPILAVQVLLVSYLFAKRYRERLDPRDYALWALGGLVLANSLLNARWPWWGA